MNEAYRSERRAKGRLNEMMFDYPTLDEAILRARLAGRHGMKAEAAEPETEDGWFSVGECVQIMAAFEEGQQARATGARCHCPMCQIPTDKLRTNELQRWSYADRRRKELGGQGLDSDEIERRIANEIDKGMAR